MLLGDELSAITEEVFKELKAQREKELLERGDLQQAHWRAFMGNFEDNAKKAAKRGEVFLRIGKFPCSQRPYKLIHEKDSNLLQKLKEYCKSNNLVLSLYIFTETDYDSWDRVTYYYVCADIHWNKSSFKDLKDGYLSCNYDF